MYRADPAQNPARRQFLEIGRETPPGTIFRENVAHLAHLAHLTHLAHLGLKILVLGGDFYGLCVFSTAI